MKFLIIGIGGILLIPFIAMLIQLAVRDIEGKGYCNSLFDAYLIPIMFLTFIGSSLIIWGGYKYL